MMQQSNTASNHHHSYIMGSKDNVLQQGSAISFPGEAPQILPWTTTLPTFNPTHYRPTHDHDPFSVHTTHRAAFFDSRVQFSAHFGLQAELQRMNAQEILDAKALAASKNHSEAERRRRERINNHLSKLRSLLPSTTKTDKASLLAEVVHHVKELKRQTSSIIAETCSNNIPTEADELTVDNYNPSPEEDYYYSKLPLIKASICCDDRPDLLQDIIKTLKSLKLKTLKAEITTLGGRVKNVLFIAGDEDTDMNFEDANEQKNQKLCIKSIEEALKAVLEKCNGDNSDSGLGTAKRQRTAAGNNNL